MGWSVKRVLRELYETVGQGPSSGCRVVYDLHDYVQSLVHAEGPVFRFDLRSFCQTIFLFMI